MDVLIIDDGVVSNCICADDVSRAQSFYPNSICLERGTNSIVSLGWLYDGCNFTQPEGSPADIRPISKLEFLLRFTAAQRIAIRTTTDPVIDDAMQLLDLADYIMINDPNTISFVEYLTTQGFLTPAEAAAVLA